MEKQPLILAPGIYSVGMWRLTNIGNYENVTIGFVQSYDRAQTDPHDAYLEVRAMLDNWVHELPAAKPAEVSQPKQTPPAPSSKLDSLMDAIRPYVDRVQVTDAEGVLIVRTKGYMKPDDWKALNVLLRGQGGKWMGTRQGLPGRETHWEIPK